MMREWIDTFLELYIAGILTVEYFWGRSDTDIKREVIRKKAARDKRKAEVVVTPQTPVSQEIK